MTKRMQEIRDKLTQNAFEFDALVMELITLVEAKKTIIVNGIEVPAPETDKPKLGTEYYFPKFTKEACVDWFPWSDDELGNCILNNGVLYLNKEDAIARAKAMLGVMK